MPDEQINALKARVHHLETALGQHNTKLNSTFKLSQSLSNLLGLLISVPNVTSEMIEDHTKVASDSRVAMHRLRRAMKPYDIAIQSRRTLGWWLDPDAKAKIAGLIAAGVSTSAVINVCEIVSRFHIL